MGRINIEPPARGSPTISPAFEPLNRLIQQILHLKLHITYCFRQYYEERERREREREGERERERDGEREREREEGGIEKERERDRK